MPIWIFFVIFLCSEARLRCAECLESPEETWLKTQKISACGGLISRSRASIESTSQLKKLVVLANSTPVATWTLSSWRDFRNKFHGFSTVFVAYNVCSIVFCLCLFVLSRLIVFVLYFVNACTFYVWDFSWSFVTHFFIIPSLISVCIIRYVMSLQRQTE